VAHCRHQHEPTNHFWIVFMTKWKAVPIRRLGNDSAHRTSRGPRRERTAKLYDGTERVVSWLTEELVALSHDVTLFASGESRTGAKLVPACPRARCSKLSRASGASAQIASTATVVRLASSDGCCQSGDLRDHTTKTSKPKQSLYSKKPAETGLVSRKTPTGLPFSLVPSSG
jgi:hypothetical protein